MNNCERYSGSAAVREPLQFVFF